MANHFLLYGRPLMADEAEAALTITGVLHSYSPGEAYEGRLQINNSVGRCIVEIIEADLPPGATVRVDNLTKEVVVKWPAFVEVVEEETVLPNGSFEGGDDGTWALGPGWSIGSGSGYDTHDGTFSARFANVNTQGSDLRSPILQAKVNDYIRVKGYVQQGASSKGNAGARVSLSYHDKDGKELQINHGKYVSSGKKSNWHDTVAEGAAPKGTAGVMVRFTAFRKKQNHPLWVDNLTWDHKYQVGTLSDPTYYIRLRVTDSLNRQAEWAGFISVLQVMLFGQLYGYYAAEGIDSAAKNNPDFVVGTSKEYPLADAVESGMSVPGAWSVVMPVEVYKGRAEGINSTFRANAGWAIETSVRSLSVYPEGTSNSLSIPETWVQIDAQLPLNVLPEGINTGMTVRPWSKS